MNPQLLKEAIDFAVANEIKNPRDLKLNHHKTFGREPFGDAIGPIKDLGDPTGVIVRNGYIVASAPPTAFMFVGNGTNMVYIDPDNDVVAVLRWIDRPAADGFVRRLLAALNTP